MQKSHIKETIFCKATYNFKEPTNRSHPIMRYRVVILLLVTHTSNTSTVCHMCDTTRETETRVEVVCVIGTYVRVLCVIGRCDMTHAQVRLDSFTSINWRIHTCDIRRIQGKRE